MRCICKKTVETVIATGNDLLVQLKGNHPIFEGLKQRTSAVEKAIDDVFRANGCSDSRIQELLKRFEIQANLKL